MSVSNSRTFIYQEHICWGNMRRVIFDKQHKCSMPAALSVLPITSRSVLISRLLEQTGDPTNRDKYLRRCAQENEKARGAAASATSRGVRVTRTEPGESVGRDRRETLCEADIFIDGPNPQYLLDGFNYSVLIKLACYERNKYRRGLLPIITLEPSQESCYISCYKRIHSPGRHSC